MKVLKNYPIKHVYKSATNLASVLRVVSTHNKCSVCRWYFLHSVKIYLVCCVQRHVQLGSLTKKIWMPTFCHKLESTLKSFFIKRLCFLENMYEIFKVSRDCDGFAIINSACNHFTVRSLSLTCTCSPCLQCTWSPCLPWLSTQSSLYCDQHL